MEENCELFIRTKNFDVLKDCLMADNESKVKVMVLLAKLYEERENRNAMVFCCMKLLNYLPLCTVSELAYIQSKTDFLKQQNEKLRNRALGMSALCSSIVFFVAFFWGNLSILISLIDWVVVTVLVFVLTYRRMKKQYFRLQLEKVGTYVDAEVLQFADMLA